MNFATFETGDLSPLQRNDIIRDSEGNRFETRTIVNARKEGNGIAYFLIVKPTEKTNREPATEIEGDLDVIPNHNFEY